SAHDRQPSTHETVMNSPRNAARGLAVDEAEEHGRRTREHDEGDQPEDHFVARRPQGLGFRVEHGVAVHATRIGIRAVALNGVRSAGIRAIGYDQNASYVA